MDARAKTIAINTETIKVSAEAEELGKHQHHLRS